MEGKARKRLEERVSRAVHDTAKPAKTHDWNRSVSATNSYWKETLDPGEILAVQRLNGWIYEALESLGVLAAQSEMAGVAALSGTGA